MVTNGSCVGCTAPGHFVSSGKYCVQCDVNCATCLSENACQTCQAGFALYMGKCVVNCPNGLYKNLLVCTPC